MTVTLVRNAAIGVLFMGALPCAAQVSPFYGGIDAQDQTELEVWAGYFWQKADTGVVAKPGEFQFSDSAMNSPLFSPLRGARATLEAVNLLPAIDCDAAATPNYADPKVAAAFRAVMLDAKVTTDAQINPSGASAHSQMIAEAPPGSVVFWTEGTKLISIGLPLKLVNEPPKEPVFAGQVSPETEEAMAKLISTGPAIAAASKGVTVAQGLITGEKDQADRFADGVQELLWDMESDGAIGRMEAAFGIYGSLPIISITFDDAYIVMDCTNGELDGPFEPDSDIDATLLLSKHPEFVAGSSIRYYKGIGCPARSAVWHLTPPVAVPPYSTCPAVPGSTPVTVLPPFRVPGTPPGTPVTLNPTVPGWLTTPGLGPWPTSGGCVATTATCTCMQYGQQLGGPPGTPPLWYRVRTICPAAAGCPPASFSGCFSPTVWYWW